MKASSPTPVLAARASSTRSILGPLTTTFIPPTWCTTPIVDCRTCAWAWQAQACTGTNPEDAEACRPAATTSAPDPPFGNWGFYSPGLACPIGYTSACTALGSDAEQSASVSGSSFNFFFPPQGEETAVGCCPTGYTCSAPNTCVSMVSAGSFTGGLCQNNQATYTTFAPPNDAEYTIWAPLIQLNWQARDLPASAPQSKSSSTDTPAASTNDASPVSDEGGLSTGAKIAIGVVVPVVVLIALGVGLMFWRKRRTARRTAELPEQSTVTPQHEMPAEGAQANPVKGYFAPPSGPPSELQAQEPSKGHVHELHG